jgi:hypothetical protein
VDELLELEASKLKQRAKINWLKHGDQNSKFYLACINQWRRNNHISHITGSRGFEVFEQDGIEGAFIDYFKNIFTSQGQVGLAKCLKGLPKKVTNLMNEKLLREPTMEEFDVAISQIWTLSNHLGPTASVTSHPNDTQYCPLLAPLNQTSQEVTHPSTTSAEARLTAEF